MISIILKSLIFPFILYLVSMWVFSRCIENDETRKSLLIASTVIILIVFVLKIIVTYFGLSPRYTLSIFNANLLYGIIYAVLVFVYVANADLYFDIDGLSKYVSQVVAALGFGGLTVLAIFGFCNTAINVTPTYKSIDKEISTYKESPTFKQGKTPVAISPKTVLNRTNKSLSDVPNSQYYKLADSSDIQAQFINGKPYYLIPLEYQDVFSYFNSGKTIPGYFKISAVDEGATPTFVKSPMKYSNSAYFNHNAERQIYRKCSTYVTTDSNPQLQISPDGTPYWVETLYKPEHLSERQNYSTLKIALLNSKNGKVTVYDTKNTPKWVSTPITSDVANNMNKSFGTDKRNSISRMFNKKGLIKPTGNGSENGVTTVFNSNGTISYFSDFTNINSDNDSGVGYSMINARTGKLTYYRVSGMMDSNGAMDNANQNYKAQKWKANMPVMYKISGRPVWVMQILDSSKAVRGYYYLDASNQTIHANDTTVDGTLAKFNIALATANENAGNTPNVKLQSIKGTIDRMAVLSNDNKMMFMLKGSNVIYTVNTQQFGNAVLAKVGDTVKIKANVVTKDKVGNVKDFIDYQLN